MIYTVKVITDSCDEKLKDTLYKMYYNFYMSMKGKSLFRSLAPVEFTPEDKRKIRIQDGDLANQIKDFVESSKNNIVNEMDYNISFAKKAVDMIDEDESMKLFLVYNNSENGELLAASRFVKKEDELIVPEILTKYEGIEGIQIPLLKKMLANYEQMAIDENLGSVWLEMPTYDRIYRKVAFSSGYDVKSEDDFRYGSAMMFKHIVPEKEIGEENGRAFTNK